MLQLLNYHLNIVLKPIGSGVLLLQNLSAENSNFLFYLLTVQPYLFHQKILHAGILWQRENNYLIHTADPQKEFNLIVVVK